MLRTDALRTIGATPYAKVEGFSALWPVRRYPWIRHLQDINPNLRGDIGEIFEGMQNFDVHEPTSREEVKAVLQVIAEGRVGLHQWPEDVDKEPLWEFIRSEALMEFYQLHQILLAKFGELCITVPWGPEETWRKVTLEIWNSKGRTPSEGPEERSEEERRGFRRRGRGSERC